MTTTAQMQNEFLAALRRQTSPVTIFLMNGFQIRGTVTGFDAFTVVVQSDGKQNFIYKHAISTIVPTSPVALSGEEMDG